MNYYRRYMADYLSKTASLSLAEHGAYSLLLDYSYLEGGSLPADQDEICRMVRAVSAAERQAVSKILDRYFVLRPEGYVNPRASAEIEKAKPIIEAARTNGVKGGRPKNNPVGFIEDNPVGLPDETQQVRVTKASQPLTPNHQPPEKEKAARGTRLNLSELPEDWKAFCLAERPDLDPGDTFASFADHWKAAAGSKGVKADWLATWRNWVRAQWNRPGGSQRSEDPFRGAIG